MPAYVCVCGWVGAGACKCALIFVCVSACVKKRECVCVFSCVFRAAKRGFMIKKRPVTLLLFLAACQKEFFVTWATEPMQTKRNETNRRTGSRTQRDKNLLNR